MIRDRPNARRAGRSSFSFGFAAPCKCCFEQAPAAAAQHTAILADLGNASSLSDTVKREGCTFGLSHQTCHSIGGWGGGRKGVLDMSHLWFVKRFCTRTCMLANQCIADATLTLRSMIDLINTLRTLIT